MAANGAYNPTAWEGRSAWALRVAATVCLIFSAYIAIRYRNQALLDLYSFRQTQTALTTLWLERGGFRLAYETPVAGAPWSIPFEFPLYQWLVAQIAQVGGLSLEAVGRLTSFAFLLGCIVPARSIVRKLGLSEATLHVFLVLLFTSPIYLYYGRTFMIETAALFFAIASIPFFLDLLDNRRLFRSASLFVIFISIAVLQKSTTGLPVLAVLAVVYLLQRLSTRDGWQWHRRKGDVLVAVGSFGVPLLVGYAWTSYTDLVKAENALGLQLTSKALANWNWGSMEQRLTSALYREVIWDRVISRNLSGWLGIALIGGAVIGGRQRGIRGIAVACIALGFLPILLFSNLHLHHDYYQVSCVIYLLFGLSVAISEWLREKLGTAVAFFFLGLIVVGHVSSFDKAYLAETRTVYDKSNSRDLSIAGVLQREVRPDGAFIAFGNDWSSSFAYLGQRKGFTVPPWFRRYDQVLQEARSYLGGMPLGAVVSCPNAKGPSVERLLDWMKSEGGWRLGVVHGCHVAVRDEKSNKVVEGPIRKVACEGNLEHVRGLSGRESDVISERVIAVSGWTTVDGKKGEVPESVFVTITGVDGKSRLFEAIRVPRPDVDRHFGRAVIVDSGFSRYIDVSAMSGKVVIGIVRVAKEGVEQCAFGKTVELAPGNS